MSKKAVILAGGLGTRLGELTRTVNKHLLPVGSSPMIFWPIRFLVKNGFDEILIVVGSKSTGEILHQVGDGSRFGAKILYAFQEGEGGIAAALSLASLFTRFSASIFPVVLGDNIFLAPVDLTRRFRDFSCQNNKNVVVFCAPCKDPELFGVAVVRDGKIVEVVEKPTYKINGECLTITGLYLYHNGVYDIIDQLKPSKRGELEISDVNNYYAKLGSLHYEMVDRWIDCGTASSYIEANKWMQEYEKNKETR